MILISGWRLGLLKINITKENSIESKRSDVLFAITWSEDVGGLSVNNTDKVVG